MNASLFSVINGLLYTLGWTLSIFFGQSHTLTVCLLNLSIIGTQSLYLYRKSLKLFTQDLFIICYAFVLGVVMEWSLYGLKVIVYPEGSTKLFAMSPLWIFTLYPLLASTFNHSFSILKTHPLLPTLTGFFGAPLTYFSASYWSVVSFSSPYSYVVIAVAWSIWFTLLFSINQSLQRTLDHVYSAQTKLTVFFDDLCSICSREKAYLQTRNPPLIHFDSLTHQEIFEQTHPDKSFAQYLQSIHAQDAYGQIYRGRQALIEIYARSNLQMWAVLLDLPGFRIWIDRIYHLFASWRLKRRGDAPHES